MKSCAYMRACMSDRAREDRSSASSLKILKNASEQLEIRSSNEFVIAAGPRPPGSLRTSRRSRLRDTSYKKHPVPGDGSPPARAAPGAPAGAQD